MAIIRYSGLVAGIRGTLGGLTCSANLSGPYVRSWGRGSRRPSPLQAPERSNLGILPASWNDLSDSDRENWSIWASEPAQERFNSLAEPYFLSGYQAFLFVSRQLQTVGRALRSSPPTAPKPEAPTSVTYGVFSSDSPNDSFVEFSPGEFDDVDCLVWGEIGPSSSRLSRPAARNLIFSDRYPVADTVLLDAGLAAAYGTIQAGSSGYLLCFSQTLEGMRSEPLFLRFTVEAF